MDFHGDLMVIICEFSSFGFLSHGGTPKSSSRLRDDPKKGIETYGNLAMPHFRKPPYVETRINRHTIDIGLSAAVLEAAERAQEPQDIANHTDILDD